MPDNPLYDQIGEYYNIPTSSTIATGSSSGSIIYTTMSSKYATKEQYEQLEKHIDELELDISYLNDKCEQQEQEAHTLANKVYDQDKLICDQDKLIKTLESKVSNLEYYTNYLNDRVNKLVLRCGYDE